MSLPQNAAQWHIILVHMPATGLMFGLVLLWIACAFKDVLFQRVALVFIILTAVATFMTADTGHDAARIVGPLDGVNPALIHEHEEAAETGTWLMYGLGMLSLVLLILTSKQKQLSNMIILVVSVLGLGVGAYFYHVAELGGHIHHPETRPGFVVPADSGEHHHT